MKRGEVKINLKNLDGYNIGEHIVTDGKSHKLYSPYLQTAQEINRMQLEVILRDHSDITIADLAVVLMSPCSR